MDHILWQPDTEIVIVIHFGNISTSSCRINQYIFGLFCSWKISWGEACTVIEKFLVQVLSSSDCSWVWLWDECTCSRSYDLPPHDMMILKLSIKFIHLPVTGSYKTNQQTLCHSIAIDPSLDCHELALFMGSYGQPRETTPARSYDLSEQLFGLLNSKLTT